VHTPYVPHSDDDLLLDLPEFVVDAEQCDYIKHRLRHDGDLGNVPACGKFGNSSEQIGRYAFEIMKRPDDPDTARLQARFKINRLFPSFDLQVAPLYVILDIHIGERSFGDARKDLDAGLVGKFALASIADPPTGQNYRHGRLLRKIDGFFHFS
jgi:hypothetical protein